MPYLDVNLALEKSATTYLNSCLSNVSSSLSGSNVTFYEGLTNIDKLNAPACIVFCSDYRELYYDTRNYEAIVTVIVKEMAADEDISQLGILSMYVTNEFVSPQRTTNFSNQNYHFNTWQIIADPGNQEFEENTIVTVRTFRFICALTP